MNETPRPPIPFAQRLTPEARAEWAAYEAANRRADRTYSDEDGFTGSHRPCHICSLPTKSARQIHNRCLEES